MRGVGGAAPVMVALLALAACAGPVDATSSTTPPDGEALFSATVLEGRAGCVTCHSRTPDHVLVGPSLSGIGVVAGSRVPGMSGAEYLRASILDPDAHVVEGFAAGRMPDVWSEVLSESEIDALVVYMEGLR